jgi:hypothetical protein
VACPTISRQGRAQAVKRPESSQRFSASASSRTRRTLSASCIPESGTRGSRAIPSARGRCAGSRGRSSCRSPEGSNRSARRTRSRCRSTCRQDSASCPRRAPLAASLFVDIHLSAEVSVKRKPVRLGRPKGSGKGRTVMLPVRFSPLELESVQRAAARARQAAAQRIRLGLAREAVSRP